MRRYEIKREEWDFSTCPQDELEHCYHYEYFRESKIACTIIKDLRSKNKLQHFDAILEKFLKGNGLVVELKNHGFTCQNSLFPFCPEWPDEPYLTIPVEERKRRMKLLKAKMRIFAPHSLKDSSKFDGLHFSGLREYPLQLMKIGFENNRYQEAIYEQKALVDGKKITCKTVVCFYVEWNKQDKVLTDSFKEWLKARRPKDWKSKPNQGTCTLTEFYYHRLRDLAAYRLKIKFGIKVKKLATSKDFHDHANKAPLWLHDSEWSKAKARAKQLIEYFSSFSP